MGDDEQSAEPRLQEQVASWVWEVQGQEILKDPSLSALLRQALGASLHVGEAVFHAADRDPLFDGARGPAAWIVLEDATRPLGHELMIELPPPLALLAIDRAMGGARSPEFPHRALLPVELGVLGFAVAECLSRWERFPSWKLLNVLGERGALANLWHHSTVIHCMCVPLTLLDRIHFVRIWSSDITRRASPRPWLTEIGFARVVSDSLAPLQVGCGLKLDAGPRLTPDESWDASIAFTPTSLPQHLWSASYSDSRWRLALQPSIRSIPQSPERRLIQVCARHHWSSQMENTSHATLPPEVTLWHRGVLFAYGRLFAYQGDTAVLIRGLARQSSGSGSVREA